VALVASKLELSDLVTLGISSTLEEDELDDVESEPELEDIDLEVMLTKLLDNWNSNLI